MFRRDLLRYSMRSLLVAVTCVALVLTVLHNRANRQREAIHVVTDLRGSAAYEYQRHPATRRMPHWTDDYLCPITQVVLNDTPAKDDDLAKLGVLRHLRVLLLQNTSITDAALSQFDSWSEMEWVDLKGTLVSDDAANRLRKSHPKCEIETHWMRGCRRCRQPFPTRDKTIAFADASICPACQAIADP